MTVTTTTTTTTVVVEVNDETPEEEFNPYPGEFPVRATDYRDARAKKSERYETAGDVLRKTSERGINFPFRDKLVTFLSVSDSGSVKQGKNLTQKRWMVTNLDKEVQILACWPGEWSQDVFEIDNRDYAKSILDLTESQFKARGRYRNV